MILILLATYRGERFLEPLLDSLRRQTYDDWQLLVRDDGSHDRTPSIVRDAAAADRRIVPVVDDSPRLGSAGNFARLMQHATLVDAEAYAFADQDDVWRPDKLDRQLRAMRELVDRHGAHHPALVHTDLEVVDEHLRTVHASFASFARVHRDVDDPFRSLLVANHVTGCTMLFNRELLRRALPMPAEARMHDWWTALCAAAWGRLRYLPEPTVRYRQHGENVVGAERPWRRYNPLAAGFSTRWRAGLRDWRRTIAQMQALRLHLHAAEEPPPESVLRRIDEFCRAVEDPAGPWTRWHRLRRAGFAEASLLRQALLAARLWTSPPCATRDSAA